MTVYVCTDGTSIVINNYDFAFDRLLLMRGNPLRISAREIKCA